MFEFRVISQQSKSFARTGEFTTLHHTLQTPELAIVATEGEIRAIPKEYWAQLPCKYLIVNTFHIFTSKKSPVTSQQGQSILEGITDVGGIHNYMGLPFRAIASDSGGFQVFSLGFGKSHNVGKVGGMFPGNIDFQKDSENPLTITDTGVEFEYDGKPVFLNPKISMDIQHRIGADIMFAFDECTSPLNSKEYTAQALDRSERWLLESIAAHKGCESKQALFGIVQGGAYEDLRKKSAEFVGKQDVPGFGIGGSLGKNKEEMYAILEWTIPKLPNEKPRHLLGIGQVRDIFEGVERGVDLFDCVIPTREARHRLVYTQNGRLSLRKMKHLADPISRECQCLACREKVTYEQLWKLFLNHDARAPMYTTVHNIQFFADLMKEIRDAISQQRLSELKEKYYRFY